MLRTTINQTIFAVTLLSFCFGATKINADLTTFGLQGSAGSGITAANEPGDTGTGSGDLLQFSTYDSSANILTLNVAWGSGNGFTDLSSTANLVNLHFVEDGLPPDVFEQSGQAFLTLDGVDQSPNSGGFSGQLSIPEEREADLLAGRVYLHIHTDDFSGGEARGYFVTQAVPEPGALGLLSFVSIGMLVRRKRKG